MAHVMINPPPTSRGDALQQLEDLRRWCCELQQKLEVNYMDIERGDDGK